MPATTAVPLVIAHRGASARHPENTLAAFRGAAELGADWVELDVRRTRDGGLAVHHDEALPGGQLVEVATVAELPPSVPLLAEALDACSPLGVNVEVKPHADLGVVGEVVAVVRAWGGAALVSSFQPELLVRCRAEAPELPTALLTFALADPAAAVAACVDAGHAALHPWEGTVDAALVEVAHGAGLALNVWTVDDPERIAALAALGVDGIVTNVPDVARAAISRR